MSHIERKQREKDNLKKSLLKAALDIAIAEGWEAVTIRRIADAVEYTTSVVYGHFENKDALLMEIAEMGFKQLYECSIKVVNENEDPKKQLLAISLANWDFAMANKELYSLMFNYKKPTGTASIIGMELVESVFERLTGKRNEEMQKLFLNWKCLRRGCISLSMEFKEHDENINPRELFIEFMERFIVSIASD
jgi:Transcriptional regulator